jgi:adenine phosphoribosyltransferase
MRPAREATAGTVADIVARHLRDVADFPHPGILFKDIVPLLADGPALAAATGALAGLAGRVGGVDLVAGVEARGFVFAGTVARELGCGLVPVRKAGKLPPPTIGREYDLEYGTARIEVPVDVLAGRRVLLVDDVLATGGTLSAAAALLVEAGASVAGIGVVLELVALGGRARLGTAFPLQALLSV